MMPARRTLSLLLSLSTALAAAASCGGSSGGDQTTKFSGAWTFKSGSLVPTCLIPGLSPFDLTGLNVTFTKVDDATIALTINPACNLHFHAADTKATVLPNQTCALDLGGALGMQNVMITTWTLSLTGDEIDCSLSGKASLCTAAGTGVLVRGTTDAGVPNHGDGGPHDGQMGSAEGGAGDGGPSDTGGADGAVETSPEAGAAETSSETGAAETSSETGAAEAGGETGTDAGVDESDGGAVD